MTTNLPAWLSEANHNVAKKFPGETGARQPVHAVYGGAHLFKFDTCRKFGMLAQRAVSEYAPDAENEFLMPTGHTFILRGHTTVVFDSGHGKIRQRVIQLEEE